jgi:hypothetical protein
MPEPILHIFTSAALNYIPKVRLLFESLRRHMPQARLHLALSDRLPEDFDLAREPFDEIHPLESLGIADWRGWAFCHDIVELSTAIKPFVLQKLLAREDCRAVLYLDPDMVAFSPLDDLQEALAEANVLLTPHQITPERSLDAVIDNEICSLKHGVYNLGFVGVAPTDEGRRFAQWWGERVYHFCRADIPQGLFTDQRWIDLAPAFFEGVAIVRSPRHNVATWNISTRTLGGSFEQGFSVDGEPLGFYHFTGFDSGAHRIMAGKYGAQNPSVTALVRWYEDRTRELARDPLSQVPWAYGRFRSGEKIARVHRRVYRERVDLQQAFPDPFDDSAPSSLLAWWRQQGVLEYPGLDEQADEARLRAVFTALTPGFRPQLPRPGPLAKIGQAVRESLADGRHAQRHARRGWEVLRTAGVRGFVRRLMG